MARETIQVAAERLREAVAAGSHGTAEGLAADYCRVVEEEVRHLGPTDSRVADILRAALDLLEWARCMTLTTRAFCAMQLGELPECIPYYSPPACTHSWAIEG
jgi:hypothetical protein